VNLEDLRAFLGTLKADEPLYFVGLGSNLLVRDGGLRGTVIFTHRALNTLRLDAATGEIHAEAGVASPKVARFSAMHNLIGAEFLAGIPGTVGGALAMNAGCYGGETWNIVRRVTVIDRAGQLHTRTPAHYRIGYRSVIKCSDAQACELSTSEDAEWFVSAVFALPQGDGAASREQMKILLSRRIATQPLGSPNAGSVFRNPNGAYAAKLIEDCGLKGHVIGGAVISTKHANFIVNTGTARAADIEALINLAQHKVKQKFGVELEREVRIIGDEPVIKSDQYRAHPRTRSHGDMN
ncbi:MAG TPA: UDP-N-acetylmuramate dehydrogenase, partial [Burkholderiales bacterium]|nr:UDP-N-acetylmuramate dehydrogenase [Burkholderiales bacterium]